MRSSAKESYAFDRLFLAHLGSRLGAEYDGPLKAPLPSRFWDMLLKLALLEALSERQVGTTRPLGSFAARLPIRTPNGARL